jgi:hypothetical protein
MATEVSRFAAAERGMALAEPSQTVQEKDNPRKLSVQRENSALVKGVICLQAVVVFTAVGFQV